MLHLKVCRKWCLERYKMNCPSENIHDVLGLTPSVQAEIETVTAAGFRHYIFMS